MPVDTLDPTWINAPGGVGPSYDSEELRRNQAFTIARGATPGSARAGILAVGDLALSLSGMNVRLGAGGCVVATAKGAYVTGFAATTTVDALQAADVTNPRRDRVVIEILDPDNGGGAGRKGQARVITGTPNASAATGGGYPAEPSGPVLTIGYADVPKSGAGSPVLTMTAPYTAAAGAPVPVMSRAEMDSLPGMKGAKCARLDLPGSPVATHDGARFQLAPIGHVARAERRTLALMTPTLARLHEITAPVEANRVLRVTLRMTGKSTHNSLYADLTFLADGVTFDAGTINFSFTNLGERVEMSGLFYSGPAKSVLFSVNSQIVLPVSTPSARVSLPATNAPAPPSMSLHVEDLGPA